MRVQMYSEKKVKRMSNKNKNKIIKVDYLARVEGEGALYLKLKNGIVSDVKFKIFEPPRFFEAFLRGRHFTEAPDITARICGICPIAYQMSSIHAMENALNIKIDEPIRELRRLIYCGEWIESHVLHIYLLHAPDFLGYHDAIEMAKDYPDVVKKALRLKKIGNKIVSIIGGREIHPINIKVGGFYHTPKKKDLESLLDELDWARETAIETVKFTASLQFPDFEQDYEFVSLRHPDEYPFNEGRLVSNRGLDIDIKEYDQYFTEEHVEHSNALHSVIKGRGNYFVGPLARYNLNYDKLPSSVRDIALSVGLTNQCFNPFKSIIIRAIETLYACEEASRIIRHYEVPKNSTVSITPKKSTGFGCTEAPRGMLYHRYSIDEQGIILDAKIVPPTSQNQKTIEMDLRHFVTKNINLSDEQLKLKCEQTIRNYDPCISCATHFLNLKIDRQ